MFIFQPGTTGRRTTFVQPGKKHRASHFLNDDKTPKMFAVVFTEGRAEVDDQLGKYMISEDIAKSSPILTLAEALV